MRQDCDDIFEGQFADQRSPIKWHFFVPSLGPWAILGLFLFLRLLSCFQTNITIFKANICEKMPILYMGLVYEATTLRMRVSSHNH